MTTQLREDSGNPTQGLHAHCMKVSAAPAFGRSWHHKCKICHLWQFSTGQPSTISPWLAAEELQTALTLYLASSAGTWSVQFRRTKILPTGDTDPVRLNSCHRSPLVQRSDRLVLPFNKRSIHSLRRVFVYVDLVGQSLQDQSPVLAITAEWVNQSNECDTDL